MIDTGTATEQRLQSQRSEEERDPLLFVHGAWHGAWAWHDNFVPWFEDLGFECHTFDLRHHGDRGGPKSLRRTRIKDYVDDLASEVSRLPRLPIIVAHSMGALIAQRYLEERSLPGAVLLAPVPLGGVWRATLKVAARHPLVYLWGNLTLDLKPMVASGRMVRSMLVEADTDEGTVQSIVDRAGSESYLAYLDMLFVTRARPPLVDTPVRVIIGDSDRLFSVREVRKLARAYGIDPVVLSDVAHEMVIGPRWESVARATLHAIEGFTRHR